jgi:YidC/Oxa1 family membrane protein insertase
MRLKAGANEFLEYKYILKSNEYLVGFDIRSQGLNKVLNSSKPLDLQWDLKLTETKKVFLMKTVMLNLVQNMEMEKYSSCKWSGSLKEETPEKVRLCGF